ncbi:MAG: hypothetical protein K2N87_07560 [Eubacterium sp.]|nr:hypothetical protein [Eubacterium sp.]
MHTNHSADTAQPVRQFYKKRLLAPAIYLLFLAVLWAATPLSELVLPHQVSSPVHFRELSSGKYTHIATTLTSLHFTGYTQTVFGYTNGYYYYTLQDNQYLFVLLAPDTCENGKPDIPKLQVRVRLIRHFDQYDTLTQQLAEDLNWTTAGIRSQIPDYLLSEPGFHKLLSLLLLGCYFLSGAYALAHLLACAACLLFPELGQAVKKRRRTKANKMLF